MINIRYWVLNTSSGDKKGCILSGDGGDCYRFAKDFYNNKGYTYRGGDRTDKNRSSCSSKLNLLSFLGNCLHPFKCCQKLLKRFCDYIVGGGTSNHLLKPPLKTSQRGASPHLQKCLKTGENCNNGCLGGSVSNFYHPDSRKQHEGCGEHPRHGKAIIVFPSATSLSPNTFARRCLE